MSYQTSSKMPRPFWLLIGAENFCVSLPSQKATSLWVVSCVLTRNDICSSVARHVSLGRSPRLCSRWKVPILAQNVRNIVRNLRENLTGKDAGPFAGIITVAYLKVCENIHRFTDVFWIQGDISLDFKIFQKAFRQGGLWVWVALYFIVFHSPERGREESLWLRCLEKCCPSV